MEDFDENDEMAAMMGFSSFGGTKKRKFDQTNSPAQDEYSASGANSTELGVRTKVLNNQQGGVEDTLGTVPTARQTTAASGLAGYLARGQALPDKPPTASPVHHETIHQEAIHQEATNAADPSASAAVSFGGPLISQAELTALRFGAQNADGDTAYFLPSFVEDPWERLLSARTEKYPKE